MLSGFVQVISFFRALDRCLFISPMIHLNSSILIASLSGSLNSKVRYTSQRVSHDATTSRARHSSSTQSCKASFSIPRLEESTETAKSGLLGHALLTEILLQQGVRLRNRSNKSDAIDITHHRFTREARFKIREQLTDQGL